MSVSSMSTTMPPDTGRSNPAAPRPKPAILGVPLGEPTRSRPPAASASRRAPRIPVLSCRSAPPSCASSSPRCSCWPAWPSPVTARPGPGRRGRGRCPGHRVGRVVRPRRRRRRPLRIGRRRAAASAGTGRPRRRSSPAWGRSPFGCPCPSRSLSPTARRPIGSLRRSAVRPVHEERQPVQGKVPGAVDRASIPDPVPARRRRRRPRRSTSWCTAGSGSARGRRRGPPRRPVRPVRQVARYPHRDRPSGSPRLRVVLLHVTNVRVHPGDRLPGRADPDRLRPAVPVRPNVDGYYQGGPYPHVHVEVSLGDPVAAAGAAALA